MKIQPSEMVTLEWLLPLIHEQLAPIGDGWQQNASITREQMSDSYHQISGALIMANTPRLGRLAQCLSQLALTADWAKEAIDKSNLDKDNLKSNTDQNNTDKNEVADNKSVEYQDTIVDTAATSRLGHFAHQLLHYEMGEYVQTGSYRQALLDRTIDKISQALGINTDAASDEDAISTDGGVDRNPIGITLPKTQIKPLDPAQYRQLLVAWRQQSVSLLAANQNNNSTLSHLATICRYLWQALDISQDTAPFSNEQQHVLWYLSDQWLRALMMNEMPQPKDYAPLLSQLGRVLEQQVVSVDGNAAKSKAAHYTEDASLSGMSAQMISRLIIDIYIEMSSLDHLDQDGQTALKHLVNTREVTATFLPHILTAIDAAITDIQQPHSQYPHSLVSSLNDIEQQLARRGWSRYEQQVKEIIEAVAASTEAANVIEVQPSIKEQLQSLYRDIDHIEQSVRFDGDLADMDERFESDSAASDDLMRQLRICVETIKNQFNSYIQHQRIDHLPSPEAFAKVAQAFQDMSLPSVQASTEQLAQVFATLSAHKIKTINWQLTQALAEGLTAIELLLDYLAQQVFDQALLTQANGYIDDAKRFMAQQLSMPEMAIERDAPTMFASSSDHDVVRYDDSGEVIINRSDALDDRDSSDHHDSFDHHNDATSDQAPAAKAAAPAEPDHQISDELQAVRETLPADDFSMDDEIREIFVEEATEVLADLDDFVPIWQQDIEDFSPLTEVRRGFHTLKGSGRMVGAMSVAEVAWAIENLLNRVLDNALAVSDEVVTLVTKSCEQLPILVADFNNKQPARLDPAVIILQVNNLLAGLPLYQGLNQPLVHDDATDHIASDMSGAPDDTDSRDSYPNDTTDTTATTDNTEDLSAYDVNDTITSESSIAVPAVLVPIINDITPLPDDADDADPDIKEIFIEEATEVLAEITPLYDAWHAKPTDVSDLTEVRRGFHTLKGSGRMVGANYSAELAWMIENLLNRALDHTITLSEDMQQLITDVLAQFPNLIDIFSQEDHKQAPTQERYPAYVPIWAACALAYSKGVDDFSYQDVRYQTLGLSDGSSDKHDASAQDANVNNDNIHNDSALVSSDTATNTSNDSLDDALQTMQSVNEMMSDVQVLGEQNLDDQAFCKIFIDEARGLLADISRFIEAHENQASASVTDEIVRAFHTLRAASGSSALSAISEVSATIEQSLEQLQDAEALMGPQHLQSLGQSVTLIEGYLNAYEKNVLSQELADDDQQDLASLQALFDDTSSIAAAEDDKPSIGQLLDADIDGLLNTDETLVDALAAQDKEQIQTYISNQRAQIERLIAKTSMSAKFTTLLEALEGAYQYLGSNLQAAQDSKVQQTLLAGHEQLIGLFDALAGSMSLKVDADIVAELQMLADSEEMPEQSAASDVHSTQAPKMQLEVVDTDIELLEIFLEEAQDIDNTLAEAFSKWGSDIDNITTLKVLQRHLHTIKGGARMAGIGSIGDLTHAAESVYEAFVEQKRTPTPQWYAIMQRVHDTLSLQIDYVGRYQESFFATELVDELTQLIEQPTLPASVSLTLPALHMDAPQADDAPKTANPQEKDAPSLEELMVTSWPDGAPDPDILEVFLEEADELVASSSKYLQLFLSNISDTVALQALQRDLHTIKGGARMVGAGGIADLAHEMETVYEELAIRRRPATKMISQLLVNCHDWLADAIFVLKHRINPDMPSVLIDALQGFNRNPDSLKQVSSASLQTQISAILAAKAKREAIQGNIDISQMPAMSGSFTEQEQSMGSHEMIRISGNLIERMINLSGESAINRARIDMGISSLTGSIEEMGVTVQRLADQLRRMESELEAQILSQIDEDLIHTEDFDPLEMDQYSSLNQLSKSLSESASDLVDINHTLLEKTRDSESLLLQLSRTQAELQDGLMNSRMVPFARLTPRLERIVRQTASELNKSVELTIINADDEMDRTILERITSPLEHMLRNAVDHGIESAQVRMSAGKKRSGQITLEVLREGSEMVIHLSDDGRGINVDAVRAKAVAQGLIDADDHSLSDLDVMQYIFNAGLTTTNEVTQISGRGVGMDVVISEIRQLGGVVSVTSAANEGSRFTIRVPLTVAVSDALVVRAADRNYAIPLAQIERVVRINPERLYEYYESKASTLNIEGHDYRVRYLNDLLSGSKLNELTVTTNSSLPVIIVKSRSGQRLALQVDQIEGSRIEVVVKPLARQLSHLAGISAATIMGDGSVMLILDLITLLRSAPTIKETSAHRSARLQANQDNMQPTVLVVDDSVTVRKVTSRLLERHGFNTMVAKDGMDAIEILQDATPDLMLLDIEMPRMDGFEVATQVRHNKRLSKMPIIMITSRTGEKHRTRALDAGVNDYMGKPFQENALLDNIQRLLNINLKQLADDHTLTDPDSRGVNYEG